MALQHTRVVRHTGPHSGRRQTIVLVAHSHWDREWYQPFEVFRAQLVEMLEMLDMPDRILFSSDYPHHDFDAPDRVLPASQVGQDFRTKVLRGNANTLLARSLSGQREVDHSGS